ncbi:MAG: NADH-quinone oxidoreductase subunit A [Candidatus Eisenbacteria bacterium]|nr:NADH-quinone oxidoreductase subunit A [Candidatus Eisenbacteria bacterium]
MNPYAPVLVVLALAVAIPAVFLYLGPRLGPKRPTDEKRTPYESGVLPKKLPKDRVPVKFYLVALLFLLFDVEAVFLIPWAIHRKALGVAGDVGMAIFFLILVLGLAYEWRKGAMEWE